MNEEMKQRLAELKAKRAKTSQSVHQKLVTSLKRGSPGNTTITLWLDEDWNKKQGPKTSKNGNTYYKLRGRLVFPFHGVQNSNSAQVFNNGTSLLLRTTDGHTQELSLGGKVDFNVYETPTYGGIVQLSIWLRKGTSKGNDPITGKVEYWMNVNVVKNGLEYIGNVPSSSREMYHTLSQVFNVTPLRSIPFSELPTPDEVDEYFAALQRQKPYSRGQAASSSSSSGPLDDGQLLAKYDDMSDEEIADLLSTCGDDERKKLSEELQKYEELKKKATKELEEKNRDRSYTRCFYDKMTSDTHRFLLYNTLYQKIGACEGMGYDGMAVVQEAPEIANGTITREISDAFKKKHPAFVGGEILSCNLMQEASAISADGQTSYVAFTTTLWHSQMHQLCGIGLVDTAKALFPRLFRSTQAILQCGLNAKDTIGLPTNTVSGSVQMADGERVTGWHASTFDILTMDPFSPLLQVGWEVTPKFAFELMQQHMADYGEHDEDDENSVDTTILMDAGDGRKATRFSAERRKQLAFAMKENPYHAFTDNTIKNLTESKGVIASGSTKRNKNNLYFVVCNAFAPHEEQSGKLKEARELYQTYYNEPSSKQRHAMDKTVQTMCEEVSEYLRPKVLGNGRAPDFEIALFQVSRRKYESPRSRNNKDLNRFVERPVMPAEDDESEVAKQMRERIRKAQRTKQQVLDDWSGASSSSSASSSKEAISEFLADDEPTPKVESTPTMEDDHERTSTKRKRA